MHEMGKWLRVCWGLGERGC